MALSEQQALSPPEGVPETAPAPFWGWRMVAGCLVILTVSSGIGFYGHAAILDPLAHDHHWSKSAVSLAVTLFFFVAGFGQFLIGKHVDRRGPRPALVVGALLFGLGYMLLGRVTSLWQLYAVYLLLALGWCGTSLVPANTLIANWFIQRRGLAMGVTMCGLSLGGFIVVPLATWAIINFGLKTALNSLGLAYFLLIVPVALFLIKARPSDVDQIPDGRPLPPRTGTKGRMAAQLRVWTRAEAARTFTFWAVVLAFLLALCGQMSFLIHQVSFLSQYLGPTGAARAVSLTALASIIGRLALSTIIDRLNKQRVVIAFFVAQGVILVVLSMYQNVVVLYLGSFVFGLTMGNILMMQPLIIADIFGMASFGAVFGTATLVSSTGMSMGPYLSGFLFDLTGDYSIVFIIFAMFSFLACVSMALARPLKD